MLNELYTQKEQSGPHTQCVAAKENVAKESLELNRGHGTADASHRVSSGTILDFPVLVVFILQPTNIHDCEHATRM